MSRPRFAATRAALLFAGIVVVSIHPAFAGDPAAKPAAATPMIKIAPAGQAASPAAATPSASSPAVAIVTPNYVDAAIRAKVSRVRSDLRSLATGIESYYVDNNCYPASDSVQTIRKASPNEPALPCFVTNCLTTPIAYLTSQFKDPFAKDGQTFAYYSRVVQVDPKTKKEGWILFSPGPNGKFDLDWKLYDPSKPQPSPEIIVQSFDPTNGVDSPGDIWRVKQ
ncbi:MAG: type II secretion system protein GspG [Candidatus Sumerlaeaceae bacterium]|nr:type II secretion system protein GspG [Candidatus Sumerlaeaceae bacterium]